MFTLYTPFCGTYLYILYKGESPGADLNSANIFGKMAAPHSIKVPFIYPLLGDIGVLSLDHLGCK